MNMITFKIKYECNEDLLPIIKSFNNVLHFTYNRVLENPKISTKDLTIVQKTLKKDEVIGSHLLNSTNYEARGLVSKSKDPIIFGGKELFKQRCQQKISREEFLRKRLFPLTSIGESLKQGNRLFKILDTNTILFKPKKDRHFILNLKNVGLKRSYELEQLIKLQNSKAIAITYKLDTE